MKKLSMFCGSLAFILEAHCIPGDEILTIENDSTYKVSISARVNAEKSYDLANPPLTQGIIAKLNSGETKVFKRSELGPEWGAKKIDITHFTIAFGSFLGEKSYVIPKEFRSNSMIRLTDEYLRKFLELK